MDAPHPPDAKTDRLDAPLLNLNILQFIKKYKENSYDFRKNGDLCEWFVMVLNPHKIHSYQNQRFFLLSSVRNTYRPCADTL